MSLNKKVRIGLNGKAFLGIFTLLSCVCILIYTILIINIPLTFEDNRRREIIDAVNQEADIINLKEDITSDSFQQDIKDGFEPIAKKYGVTILVSDSTKFNTIFTIGEEKAEEAQRIDIGAIVCDYMTSDCYIIDVETTLRESIRVRDVLFSNVTFVVCVILVLSLIGAYIAANIITKPVRQLNKSAIRMAEFKKEQVPYLARKDEIGALAHHMQDMYDMLLLTLEEERQQKQKREQFFAAVSHELKTPVTILQGELEGMLYQIGDYKDRDVYLKHSLEVLNDMNLLIKNILLVSKSVMNVDSLEETDISELCFQESQKYIPFANERKIDLLCDTADGIKKSVNPEMFTRVISNLLSNAIKYSPKGAYVIIHVDEHQLYVENSGVSIPKEKQKKIFEPFVVLEESRNRNSSSSGLGLYIVRTILESHGFTYGVKNTDSGVRFEINFI